MKLSLLHIAAYVCMAGIPANAFAATLVDNLSTVRARYYINVDSNERAAQQFRTTSDLFVLTDVTIIGFSSATNQPLALRIYASAAGQPTSPLATVHEGTTGIAGFNNNQDHLVPSVFGGLSISLLPDTDYWLVLENTSGFDGIEIGTTPLDDQVSGFFGPGYRPGTAHSPSLTQNIWLNPRNDIGARINAIPEPNSTLLLVAAALCLLSTRRILKFSKTGNNGAAENRSGAAARLR